MTNVFKPSAQGTPTHAQSNAPEDKAARARAIIEAQLAKKRGGGEAHARTTGEDSKGSGKVRAQTTAMPIRPDSRGKRG